MFTNQKHVKMWLYLVCSNNIWVIHALLMITVHIIIYNRTCVLLLNQEIETRIVLLAKK